MAQGLRPGGMTGSILAKEKRMPMRCGALKGDNSIVKAAESDEEHFDGTIITAD